MFLKKKQTHLGLDIGAHTIKFVQVTNVGGSARVEHVGSVPTPRGVFAEDKLANPDMLIAELKQAASAQKLNTKGVISVIPEKHVITRNVRMPVMPEAEMAASLKWEIEKYVPLSGEDLIMDMVKMDDHAGGDEKETNVLLIAVPKDIVHPYAQTILNAGYKLEALDTVPFALCRCFCPAELPPDDPASQEIVACLDIGESGTSVVIFREGLPVFSRNVTIGGQDLTNIIVQTMNVKPEEAEKLKRELGEILPESSFGAAETKNQLSNCLRMVLTEFVYEVRRCLDYVKIRWRGQPIERSYLTGGTALLPGLPEFLSEQLELPVAVGNLNEALKEVLVDNGHEQLHLLTPEFAVALGLALREVVG